MRYFLLFCTALVYTCMLEAQTVTANFSVQNNDTVGCTSSPLIAKFLNTSTPSTGINSQIWRVWAGSTTQGTPLFTSSLNSPAFSFINAGAYTVQLIVSGSINDDTLTKTNLIRIYPTPTPAFAATDSGGCAPFSFQLQNTSVANVGSITSSIWSFSPSNVTQLTGLTPSATIGITGLYNVTLVTKNSKGCIGTLTKQQFIQVYSPAVPAFSAGNPATCAPPLTINGFSAAATTKSFPYPVTYQWTFSGAGVSPSSFTGVAPTAISYTNSGNYDVTLNVVSTEQNCSASLTKTGYVSIGSINSNFTASKTTLCAGEAFTLAAASPSGATFSWDFDNNGVYDAVGSSVVHSYSAAGVYDVKMRVVKSATCQDSTIKLAFITVNPSPTANFSLTPTLSCVVPTAVTFTNTSVGQVSQTWVFGGGQPNSALLSPTASYTTFGNFAPSLIVTNSFGCKDTATKSLSLVKPQAQFSGSPVSGCVPLSASLTDASTATEPITSWKWTFSGVANGISPATSTLQNPAVNITKEGFYTVKLVISSASGCKDSLTQTNFLRADSIPIAAFSSTPPIVCARNIITATSTFTAPAWTYHWDFKYDPNIGFNENRTGNPAQAAYADTGAFNVALIVDNNGCQDTAIINNAVYVNAPVARFGVDKGTACGFPASFVLTDKSLQPATLWEWIVDGVVTFSSPTSLSPTVVFNNPATDVGNHIIRLRVRNTNTGCVDSVQTQVFVGDPHAVFATTDTFGCRPFPVTFSNSSFNASTYSWTFGDGGSSSSVAPTHTYADSGHFSVRLVATDVGGCTDTLQKTQITRVVGPYAKFSATSVVGCAPFSASFIDQSVAADTAHINTWKWNFGDTNVTPAANTDSIPSPTHLYALQGNYSVKLVISDTYGCKDSITKANLIKPTFPKVDFKLLDTVTCAGNPIQIQNLSSAIGQKNAWTMVGGTPATSNNTIPSFTYNPTVAQQPQQYTLKLVVSDVNNCKDSLTKTNYITIEKFVADFEADTTFADCPPLPVNFTDKSAGSIANWSWTFGDGGTGNIQNPGHTYLVPGNFTVALTATHEDGCTSVATKSNFITVDGPRGTVTLAPKILCPADSFTIVANVQRTDTVFAIMGDGNIIVKATGNNTTKTLTFKHAYTIPGKKIIAVTGKLAGCERTLLLDSVQVSVPPVAAFAVADNTPCEDAPVAFTDQSANGSVAINQWKWTFSGGASSTLQNPAPSFPNAGAAIATLIVTDPRNCKDTATLPLQVQQRPTVNFIASDTVSCAPKIITFTDQTTAGASALATWAWTFTGNNTQPTSTQQNPNITFGADGKFPVQLVVTDANGCADTTLKSPFFIRLRHPVANITAPTTLFCQGGIGSVSGATSISDKPITQYAWTLTNPTAVPTVITNQTTTTSSYTHTFTPFGKYDVNLIITDALGCKDTAFAPQFITTTQPPKAKFAFVDSTLCLNNSLQTIDLSTKGVFPSGGNIKKWRWNFGDPTTTADTSLLQNPIGWKYSLTQTFKVALLVTDSIGCKNSDTVTVTTLAPPNADFKASDTVGCAPMMISFIDQTTAGATSGGAGALTAWNWSFIGNATQPTATAQNPNITFGADGKFPVQLVVTDANGCKDTTLKSPFYVRLRHPIAKVRAADSLFCQGAGIAILADQSSSDKQIAQYAWTLTNTSTAPATVSSQNTSGNSYVHTFTAAGVYDVQVIVQDVLGCKDTALAPLLVTATRAPIAKFALTDTAPCANVPLIANNLSTVAATPTGGSITHWKWEFNDPTTTADTAITPNATWLYTNVQPYAVVLTITDSLGCTDRDTVMAQLRPYPIVDFGASDTVGCAPKTILFTDKTTSSAAIQSRQWSFIGNTGQPTANSQNPSIAFANDGKYPVQLIVNDVFGCSDTLLQSPFYIRLRHPQAQLATADSLFCRNSSVVLSAQNSSSDTLLTQYAWQFSNTTTGVITDINTVSDTLLQAFPKGGVYDVRLIITDVLGCSDTALAPAFITATQLPKAQFAFNDSTPCFNLPLLMSDLSQQSGTPTGGALVKWQWNFGDPGTVADTSLLQNPTWTHDTATQYVISLTITDALGCRDSVSHVVDVRPLPIVDFTASDTVGCAPKSILFTNKTTASAAITSWDWQFIGNATQPTAGAQSPSVAFGADGKYPVQLIATDVFGCTDTLLKSPFYIRLRHPQAKVRATDSLFCAKSTIDLLADQSSSDKPLVQYLWTLTNTTASPNVVISQTTNTPVFTQTFAQYGSYNVQVIVEDNIGCRDTVLVAPLVTATDLPKAKFSFADTTVCDKQSVIMKDLSQAGNMPNGGKLTAWKWNFGDKFTAADTAIVPNPTWRYDSVKTYNIALLVIDSLGCQDRDTVAVTILPLPKADFAWDTTQTCAPTGVQFTDKSTGKAPMAAWKWSFGTGTTANDSAFAQNPSHTYLADGSYTASLIVIDANNCSDTLVKPNALTFKHPTAVISTFSLGCQGDTVKFNSDTSLPAFANVPLTKFNWEVRNNSGTLITTNTAKNFNFVFLTPDIYRVVLTVIDRNGCQDTVHGTFEVRAKIVPDPITIKRVTVISPNTVRIEFKPHPIPVGDFAAYYVYRNGTFIDTIGNINDTVYVDAGTNATTASRCYQILVKNICRQVSVISKTTAHCTVELAATPQSDAIQLKWNAYSGWNPTRYDIYRAKRYSDPLTTPMASVAGNVLTYTDANMFCRDSVYYRVVAIGAGATPLTSESDISGSRPNHTAPAVGHDMAYASVVGNAVEVAWRKYQGYKPHFWTLEKLDDNGIWRVLKDNIPAADTSLMDAQVLTNRLSYSYRVSLTDSCADKTPVGNIGKTMVLGAVMEYPNENPFLSWNPYEQWRGGVLNYYVYRLDEGTQNFTQIAMLNNGTLTYLDDSQPRLPQPEYCYRIEAREAGGNRAVSVSNDTCLIFAPKLFVANSFSPNGDGINDRFVIPTPYVQSAYLRIFDRWGKEIFATNNLAEGWDGKANGEDAPEGVYVFTLTGVGYDKTTIERVGSITLFR